MNKIYKLVWSTATQTWCCVAETAKARGKASRAGASQAGLAAIALLFALPATAAPPSAAQLPTAGQVVAGQAQIKAGAAPATLDIVQSTQRAAIDWQSFSIGSAAQVNFLQPSTTSVNAAGQLRRRRCPQLHDQHAVEHRGRHHAGPAERQRHRRRSSQL